MNVLWEHVMNVVNEVFEGNEWNVKVLLLVHIVYITFQGHRNEVDIALGAERAVAMTIKENGA